MNSRFKKIFQLRFALLLPITFLTMLLVLPVRSVHSTTKLKKLHSSINMKCKSCHHKPKKGAPTNIGPTPANKKCYQCHIKNRRVIKRFSSLPGRLKKFHIFCSQCHERNGKRGVKAQLKKHLRSNSTCLLCHK